MLEVKVGDQVRDCDPRSPHVKEVVSVNETHITVKRGPYPPSKVRRDRVHNKSDAKKGYYLIPTAKEAFSS